MPLPLRYELWEVTGLLHILRHGPDLAHFIGRFLASLAMPLKLLRREALDATEARTCGRVFITDGLGLSLGYDRRTLCFLGW